jgi:hypothetical protein
MQHAQQIRHGIVGVVRAHAIGPRELESAAQRVIAEIELAGQRVRESIEPVQYSALHVVKSTQVETGFWIPDLEKRGARGTLPA